MSFEEKSRSEVAPEFWHENREHSRKLAQVINGILDGQTNNHFVVTLDAGSTSTSVPFPPARSGTSVLLFPQNSEAATLARTSNVFASGSEGQVTVSHGAATGGESYSLVVVG